MKKNSFCISYYGNSPEENNGVTLHNTQLYCDAYRGCSCLHNIDTPDIISGQHSLPLTINMFKDYDLICQQHRSKSVSIMADRRVIVTVGEGGGIHRTITDIWLVCGGRMREIYIIQLCDFQLHKSTQAFYYSYYIQIAFNEILYEIICYSHSAQYRSRRL